MPARNAKATRAKKEGAAKPLSSIAPKKAALPTMEALAKTLAQVAEVKPDAFVGPPRPQIEKAALSAADRENPAKLEGDDLRKLAHRRGLSRTALERMDDAKIRRELTYITYRQYAPD